MCTVTYSLIKSVGEEHKVIKRGREYHGCEEEYYVDKRLLRRISSEEEGKGDLNLWGKIKIYKNGDGEEY